MSDDCIWDKGGCHKQLPAVQAHIPSANTLANRVQEYLIVTFKGCAPRTIAWAKHVLEEFEVFVGDKPIDRLLFLQWAETMEKRGLHANTINKKSEVIRRFFKWAEECGYLAQSQAHHIPKYRPPPRRLPSIFTDAEYERIKESTLGTHNYFLTVVGYRTGMSMVDICHLRWTCIDMEQLYIHTNRIKTMWRGFTSEFWVPILANSDLHLMLQDLRANHRPVFNNANDDYVNPELKAAYVLSQRYVVESYGYALKRIGIKDKTHRNWRNTFMSHVANSGGNMGLAVRLTAHTDPSVYAQYIRPDIEALRTIVQNAFTWAESKQTIKQLRETNT